MYPNLYCPFGLGKKVLGKLFFKNDDFDQIKDIISQ